MDNETKAVVDFDHFRPEYVNSWQADLSALHDNGSPVAWTEAHGGFWIISDYDAVVKAANDYETFSSVNDVSGGSGTPKGILIPANFYQLALNEQDPPESTRRRILEAPLFTPKYLRRWSEVAARHIDAAITSILSKGEGDFFADLAMPVPAKTTLHLCGVNEEDWKLYAEPAHLAAELPANSPDAPLAEMQSVLIKLVALITERRRNPKDDMASALALGKIDGELIDIDVAAGMLLTLATGGFDTATSLLCHALLWLGDHRETWPALLEDPRKLDQAIDELLRAFPPALGTARNVTKDVEVCGQQLKAGDRVMLSWGAANRDPKKFECPAEVRIDRPNAGQHVTFGGGPHRCLGAPLARMEARMVLDAVMRRLPTYRILKDRIRLNDLVGSINGFHYLPFVLDPV